MRSAANTPNCAVKEDATRIKVLVRAKGTSSLLVSAAQSSGDAVRRLKYMAKRAAKNITSLPSHTIVPTEVGLGRLICLELAVVADIVQS